MTSFKFPPPPPPPPRASPASDATPNTQSSQRGGHGRGRVDRGRVRGTLGRGRGQFGGHARGGYGQSDSPGNAYPRGGPRGGFQQHNPGRGSRNSHGNPSPPLPRQHQQPAPQASTMPQIPNTPSSAYGNPTLSSPALNGVQIPQVDPNILVQAMSFMAMPAGMQSIAAFANHMTSANTGSQFSPQQAPGLSSPQKQDYSPPLGMNKRKRDDRYSHHGSLPSTQPAQTARQPSKKPPRAKCKTAPEVPSFGFTLPPGSASKRITAPKPNANAQQQKPKVNLGRGLQ